MPRPLRINPLSDVDSYKETQVEMIDENLTKSMNYYCNRGGIFSESIFFGLQYQLISEFEGRFFTQDDLDEEYENSQNHFYKGFPYPRAQWQYILDKHEGRLPIEIRAIKEGQPFNIANTGVNNAVFTTESTDDKCAWLPGWCETRFMRNWYGSATGTLSREVKKIAKEYLTLTSDSYEMLPYMLHDFGARAVSCGHQAAIGGASHLINFQGTDTKIGMGLLHQYYGAPRVSGKSVPASEHFIGTMLGKEGERTVTGKIIGQYKDAPIVSIVIDSYDDEYFVREILGGTFRDQIIKGKTKIVARPDSGDPVIKVPILLDILADRFGYSVNNKGFKVLSPCVGLIWGDGIDIFGIRRLYEALRLAGWSVENVIVGMGGGLLQKVNRDTLKTAMKFCNLQFNNDGIDCPVFKQPKGDPSKASFAGRPALIYNESSGLYRTILDTGHGGFVNHLELVFRNGDMKRLQTLSEMRILAEV